MSSNSSASSDDYDTISRKTVEFIRQCSDHSLHHYFEPKQTLDILNLKMKHDWDKVKSSTDMEDLNTTESAKHYTFILESFLDNDLQVPPCLFESLFQCNDPNLMNNLFNNDLVNLHHPRNFDHLNMLMNKNDGNDEYIFVSLSDIDELTHTYELIMSIVVLIYKIKTYKFRESIVKAMNNSFAEFLFFEKYDNSVRKTAVRRLLEALILNGVFNLNDLNSFLMRTKSDVENHHFHQHHHQNQIHILDVSSSSSDDSSSNDEDDDDDPMMVVDIDVAAIGPVNNNNQTITVADKIQLNNISFYTDCYPLTLKNLCRIRIKNCLVIYNERNVDSLEMLPLAIRKFLLFEENIMDVLKLTKNFRD